MKTQTKLDPKQPKDNKTTTQPTKTIQTTIRPSTDKDKTPMPTTTKANIQPQIECLVKGNQQFNNWQRNTGTYKYDPQKGTFVMEPNPNPKVQ